MCETAMAVTRISYILETILKIYVASFVHSFVCS
jgi:hypothetical protein